MSGAFTWGVSNSTEPTFIEQNIEWTMARNTAGQCGASYVFVAYAENAVSGQ